MVPFGTPTEFTSVLAWLTVLVAVPLNAVAALLLLKKSREAPHLRVLRERFIVAVVTTLVVAFFGAIFINNDQTIPPLSLDATKWITRLAMLTLALVSAGGWLWIYFSSRRSDK